jgi:hypothetical protein
MSPVFGSEHERTAALSAELQALHGEMFNRPGDANWQAVSDYLLLQWESQQPWPLPRRRKRSGLIRWLRDRKDIA